jgi:beta-1,4-mannosyl-glycoprotein beta-1,4-N-acetylglucosaminyltransferase
MKIINVFQFYNEISMLEYKLAILNDHVDYFVLAESTHTYVGSEKELYFEKIKNNDVFSKYKDKIIHLVVDDFPYKKPNIDYQQNQQWRNENYQRICLSKGLDMLNLDDEDVIVLTDLDEIPNPVLLQQIKNKEITIDNFYDLTMDNYYFNFLNLSPLMVYASKIFNYKLFKDSKMNLHDIRSTNYHRIEKGGWHLGWFGDKEFCKNKIREFAHVELNTGNIDDLYYIKSLLHTVNLCDSFKTIPVDQNTNLPPYYKPFFDQFSNNSVFI